MTNHRFKILFSKKQIKRILQLRKRSLGRKKEGRRKRAAKRKQRRILGLGFEVQKQSGVIGK